MTAARSRRRALVVLPLAALVVASVPRSAHASPLIELMGSLGDNGGMQGVVSGAGAASTTSTDVTFDALEPIQSQLTNVATARASPQASTSTRPSGRFCA